MLFWQYFQVEGDGVVIDDPRPQPDGETELPVVQRRQPLHLPEIARAEDAEPYLAQVQQAFPEQLQHSRGIHVDMFEPDGVLETEGRHRLRTADGRPYFSI